MVGKVVNVFSSIIFVFFFSGNIVYLFVFVEKFFDWRVFYLIVGKESKNRNFFE